ncbi:hypothetical protein EON65_42985 [archaeon]|nr:MAG: hypothetical protein EON65_42985 [archaeon]
MHALFAIYYTITHHTPYTIHYTPYPFFYFPPGHRLEQSRPHRRRARCTSSPSSQAGAPTQTVQGQSAERAGGREGGAHAQAWGGGIGVQV